MMRGLTALLACIFLCGISVTSQAAEVSCVNLYEGGKTSLDDWSGTKRIPTAYVTCLGGFLTGEISKGDYDKVATFIRAHHPFLSAFDLASAGGDVDEALKIGRLFRKYLITTFAPTTVRFGADLNATDDDVPHLSVGLRDLCRGSDCICASACALIWTGGVGRIGTVGLHRPRINDPMFRGLPPADASNAYRQVLGRIAAYLDEMEVPKSTVALMVATSSSDIHWVREGEVDEPPSIAEWVEASCGPDPLMNWVKTGERQNKAEVYKQINCVRHLYLSNRDRLGPP
jgi:hypothetical protein